MLCAEHESPACCLPASSASCPSLGCALLWSQALDCWLQQGRSGLSLDFDGPVLSSQCGIPGAPTAGALLVATASGLGSRASTWPPERWDSDGGSTLGSSRLSLGAQLCRLNELVEVLAQGPLHTAGPLRMAICALLPRLGLVLPCPSFLATLLSLRRDTLPLLQRPVLDL